ncbi:MAG TPA: hypothetical protein VJP87_06995 [Candidatus Acidoferrales bacterium]|nr:hypothetical protein [Candidatus Acidoferrales bacterium]
MGTKKISRREWIASSTAALGAAAFAEPGEAGTRAQAPLQSVGGREQSSPPQPMTAPDGQQLYQGTQRADWMQNPRYAWGVMTHYLADWQSQVNKLDMNVDLWNKMIDGWDVDGMAKRLASVGAGHYQLSIGQNSGYYLSPNATYDKTTGIAPSKCSRRDLVADFYEPLRRRDIKLMVYLPSGAPNGDQAAKTALEWQDGGYPNKSFQRKWEAIIREWSQRWGKKVAGWWLDGVVYPDSMYRSPEPPNFASLAAAARAGNADACVAFNPGVYNRLFAMSPDEDFTAGEIDDPNLVNVRHQVNGRVDGSQIHMLCFLGEHWGKGEPRFTTEQAVAATRKVRDWGGAVTLDVPVAMDGTISKPFMNQLEAIGNAFPR